MRANKSRAFTLVELLVVIGIIALLISVLLPALSGARRSAATIKCAAQLRDIGNSFQLYSVDNQGYFPVVQHENYIVGTMTVKGTGSSSAHWWDFVGKYLTKSKLGVSNGNVGEAAIARNSVFWGCPGWDGYLSGSAAGGGYNRIMPGYSMNYRPRISPANAGGGMKAVDAAWVAPSWLNDGDPKKCGRFFKATEWSKPSERCLLTDGKFFSVEQTVNTDGNLPGQESRYDITYSVASTPGENTFDVYRHGRRPGNFEVGTRLSRTGGKVAFNIVYCDGHVATATSREDAYRSIRLRFPG